MDPKRDTTTRGAWDYSLVVLTVVLLGALGVQSLLGTLYSWWAYRTTPGWEQAGQPAFIVLMNTIAAPIVIALVVVMGLCVPKRLLSRGALAIASVGMVCAGALVGLLTASVANGLTAYLVAAGTIQVLVIVLTLAGARGLGHLSESRLAKTGSGLLHLGFIVFALVVVALQRSALMLPASVAAAVLLTGGSALSFYARTPPPNTDDAASG